MRRTGIVVLAVCALFTINAVAGDTKAASQTKPANATKAASPAALTEDVTVSPNDSPLVRAAKIGLQARMHPKSRIVIDSTNLVVSHRSETAAAATTVPAAVAPGDRGRSWQSGNSGDASAIAANEQRGRDQVAATEQARQTGLRQEQEYMASQELEPYAEVIDDHVEKRLTEIPAEMKQKPPM
ncbi:MAG TPA: hypothetical protein VN380_01870 [Thermoanaerobaculia bacterium]|jgi:hypothetical protein|nr:hypothetical protein [Thermoanaerobaculia bacterium]